MVCVSGSFQHPGLSSSRGRGWHYQTPLLPLPPQRNPAKLLRRFSDKLLKCGLGGISLVGPQLVTLGALPLIALLKLERSSQHNPYIWGQRGNQGAFPKHKACSSSSRLQRGHLLRTLRSLFKGGPPKTAEVSPRLLWVCAIPLIRCGLPCVAEDPPSPGRPKKQQPPFPFPPLFHGHPSGWKEGMWWVGAQSGGQQACLPS